MVFNAIPIFNIISLTFKGSNCPSDLRDPKFSIISFNFCSRNMKFIYLFWKIIQLHEILPMGLTGLMVVFDAVQ